LCDDGGDGDDDGSEYHINYDLHDDTDSNTEIVFNLAINDDE
jgi:hypothetical protein